MVTIIGEAQDQAKSYTHEVMKSAVMKEKVVDTAKSATSQAHEATGSVTREAGQVKDKLMEFTEGLLEQAKQTKEMVLE